MERGGISAFIIPEEQRLSPEEIEKIMKEADSSESDEPSEEDWIMFNFGEKILDEVVQEHLQKQKRQKPKKK